MNSACVHYITHRDTKQMKKQGVLDKTDDDKTRTQTVKKKHVHPLDLTPRVKVIESVG